MIDTFRNTTQSVNQKFVPKVQLRPVPVTVSNSRKFDPSIMNFTVRHFAVECSKDIHSEQRKNE